MKTNTAAALMLAKIDLTNALMEQSRIAAAMPAYTVDQLDNVTHGKPIESPYVLIEAMERVTAANEKYTAALAAHQKHRAAVLNP